MGDLFLTSSLRRAVSEGSKEMRLHNEKDP